MTTPAERHIARTIAGLSRETRALARASQAARRSVEITDGPVSYYDEDGIERLVIGPGEEDDIFTIQEVNGPPPPQPTDPLVTEVTGGVVILYDGTYEDADIPADFSHTEIHAGEFPDYVADDSTQIGTFASSVGGEYFYSIPAAAGPRYYSLVAVSRSLQESEKSFEVEATGGVEAGETSDGIPPAASPPTTLTALYASLTARWPAQANADLVGYEVWMDAPDIVAAPVAEVYATSVQLLTEPDGTTLRRGIDYTVWVVAFDEDGPSPTPGASDIAEISTVTLADIAQEVQDAIDVAEAAGTNAQASANSKNAIWYRTTQPPAPGPDDPPHSIDDVWFDTDDGYKPYAWDGDSWEAKTWGHQSIATLDMGKATVGLLVGARIAAAAIRAEHLTVGTILDGVILNSSFADDLNGWITFGATGGTIEIDPTGGFSGAKAAKITKNATAIAPGIRTTPQPTPLGKGKWAIEVKAKCNSAASNAVSFRVQWLDVNKASLGFALWSPNYDFTTTDWEEVNAQVGTDAFPAPSGAKYFLLDAFLPAIVPDGTIVWIDDYTARELTNTVQIADGAVLATKVGADIIVANEVYSPEGYIGTLKADQIDSGIVDATLGILGALEIGTNITIDPINGIVITLDDGEIRFPADGSAATVTAGINAKWLTVEDNLSIRGTGEIQGVVDLANGITAPQTEPSVSSYYNSTPIAAFGEDDSDLFSCMIEWSSTQYMVAINFFGGGLRYVNKDATYSWGFDAITTGAGWAANVFIAGLCKVGSDIYVLVQDNNRLTAGTFFGNWYIYRINGGTFLKTSEVFVGGQGIFGGSGNPYKGALVEIGGTVGFVWMNSSKEVILTRYHPTTFAEVGVTRILNVFGTRQRIKDAHYGPHGLASGNELYVVAEGFANVQAYSPSVTPTNANSPTWTDLPASQFRRANNTVIEGLAFDTRAESGTTGKNGTSGQRFQSYTSTNLMYDYGRNVWSELVRTQYAWYDGVGTTHRTQGSPEFAYQRPARAGLQIETPAAPDVLNTDPANLDKADRIILYGAVGEAPKEQVRLVVGKRSEVFWNTLSHAGALPSATNEFSTAGVTPGILQSKASDARGRMIELSGAGEGRVGPLEWDIAGKVLRDSGSIAVVSGTFTGSLRVMRIGQMVWVQGGVGRAASFQTGFTAIGANIPADWRPVANRFGPGCVAHATTATYQFRIDTDGTVNVRQSAAIAIDMQINFCYFLD